MNQSIARVVFAVSVVMGLALLSVASAGDRVFQDRFAEVTRFVVTATATVGGVVSPPEIRVQAGIQPRVLIEANNGYSLSEVAGSCQGELLGQLYIVAPVVEDCTIDPVFIGNAYTITFDTQGGTMDTTSQGVTFGAAVGALPTPALLGFSLSGWNTQPDGSGDSFSEDTAYDIVGDTTLYAQWVVNQYDVSLSASPSAGGTVTGEGNFDFESSVTVTAEAATGYTFFEWTEDGSSVSNQSSYTFAMPANDRALVANFVEDTVVSVATPDAVSVTAESGLNEDGENFSEFTILPDFGHILRRSQVSTDCGADLVWQNNTVRIEPVTADCNLVIEAPRFSPMPDTGITTCSSENALADCPIDGYPGQDGEHGLDSFDDLIKIGSGAGSRDFTKLDADGEPLPANASNWSCVRDNQTGLVWERKINNSDSIHHFLHTFTWYNEDAATNGGGAGTTDGGDCEGLVDCDTSGLVAAVNEKELCGRTDWSLPSPVELSSLLSWASITSSSLMGDANYFSNVLTSAHWTFIPRSADFATVVNFGSTDNGNGGLLGSDPKGTRRPALLVSRKSVPLPPVASNSPPPNSCDDGIPSAVPSESFSILSDDSLVRDERTGLIWQRCMLSQTWNSANQDCENPTDGVTRFTWQEALQAAAAETPSGWRLPNRHEAATIMEFCNQAPPINQEVFPNTVATFSGTSVWANEWTSSPNIQRPAFNDASTPNRAWSTELVARGRIASLRGVAPPPSAMTNAYHVRLVRDDVPFTELSVTSSGASAYIIDGQSNPTLQLVRGQSYRFNVNASGHPFLIKTAAVTGTGSTFDQGVSNNGAQSGVVQFDVPLDAPDTLFYICQLHGAMQGQINIIDP